MSFQFVKRPTRSESENDLLKMENKTNIENDLVHNKFPEIANNILPTKKSIFAIQMEQKRASSHKHNTKNDDIKIGFPMASHRDIVTISPNKLQEQIIQKTEKSQNALSNQDINHENMTCLEQMTEKEKETARQDIYDSLNLKSINYLMNRRSKNSVVKNTEDNNSGVNQDESSTTLCDDHESKFKPNMTTNLNDSNDLETGLTSNMDKLAWISTPVANSEGESRFDFKGILIDHKNDVTPEYSGLNHHGESPDLSGYTLLELLHLSKSTVSIQRIIAFLTIGRILQNVYNEEYSGLECKKYLNILLKNDLLISVRIGIDQSHPTLIDQSLTTLSIFLGCYSQTNQSRTFEDLFHFLSFTNHGERSISLSRQSQISFKSRSLGRKIELNIPESSENYEDILTLLKEDYVLGLISTNILVRFRYILESECQTVLKVEILSILIVFASHSTNATEDILACPGLIDIIQKSMMINWPTNDHNDILVAVKYLRLFHMLSQGSLQACEAIYNHGIVTQIVYFIINIR
jgi:hypothetical protein